MHNKKYKKIKVIFHGFLTIALLGMTVTPEAKSLSEKELVEQIKLEIEEEVRDDLMNEMMDMVRQEVKVEIEKYLAQYDQMVENDSVVVSSEEEETMERKIQGVIRETLREFKMKKRVCVGVISDHELDQYQGAGINPSLGIGSGINKAVRQPVLILAKATNKIKKRLTKKEEELTAGEQKSESVERVLQQKGGMLLLQGDMQGETSFAYSNFSSNRINVDGILLLDVFAVGEISTETIQRDIFIETVSVKYGLWNNFQIEARVPYRQENDRFTTTTGTEKTDFSSGIGDVDFGVSRQIGWEDGWKPDLVASLNVKAPTGQDPYNQSIGMGTGHWSTRAALIAVKSSDPLVVFGSLSYTYNFERNDIENFGDVKPGDSFAYSLGTVIALSYQTAINFSFNHTISMKTERNDTAIAGSFLNIASFKAGINWALSEKASVDVGVSIGITPVAPDMTLEIRFPIKF